MMSLASWSFRNQCKRGDICFHDVCVGLGAGKPASVPGRIIRASASAQAPAAGLRSEEPWLGNADGEGCSRCQRMPDCSGSGSSRLSSSRRQLLGGWVLVGVASALLPAAAEQEVSTTPKAFVDLARKLTKGLIESIELEASGAEEREVRRSADASKDLVREFVQRWKSNPLVQQDPVFIELRGAIQELGNFYLANGSRARLTREVEESIVTKLYAAQAALPPEPEKKGLFGLL